MAYFDDVHYPTLFPMLTIIYSAVLEYAENESSAWIYRPSFRENKPKTLVFHDWKPRLLNKETKELDDFEYEF